MVGKARVALKLGEVGTASNGVEYRAHSELTEHTCEGCVFVKTRGADQACREIAIICTTHNIILTPADEEAELAHYVWETKIRLGVKEAV